MSRLEHWQVIINPLPQHRHVFAHAVPDNTHRQLYRSYFGVITSHIPNTKAEPRGVGLCFMDSRVLSADVREHHYLA